MAARKNFYAVRRGISPGIYRTWEECKKQVEGFPRAEYKGFVTRDEAEAYMRGENATEHKSPVTSTKLHEASTAKEEDPRRIHIYADGACTGNPGPGGYGVVILHNRNRTELSAGFRRTTNNRMEIMGCIAGLKALPEPSDVTMYSDSRYVVNAINESWAVNWRRRGWKRRLENGESAPAANADLWSELLDLCDRHRVIFEWVRGHAGNVENERCDVLARAAAAAANLSVDTPYENGIA